VGRRCTTWLISRLATERLPVRGLSSWVCIGCVAAVVEERLGGEVVENLCVPHTLLVTLAS
jgi:hypothetical protein